MAHVAEIVSNLVFIDMISVLPSAEILYNFVCLYSFVVLLQLILTKFFLANSSNLWYKTILEAVLSMSACLSFSTILLNCNLSYENKMHKSIMSILPITVPRLKNLIT